MSDDITGDLDLLGDWLDAKGYTEEAGLCTLAMDEINKLRTAMHDIYEVYAGSDGFTPKTFAEECLQERIKEMAYIAAQYKRAKQLKEVGE